MDVDSPEAFTLCFNERHRCGGHLWEVCRGGNSTHMALYVAHAFRNQLDDPKFKEVPFEDRFGMLVDIEYSNRKNNRQSVLSAMLDSTSRKQISWISNIFPDAG